MHESEDRGKLVSKGKAIPDDVICRLLGLDKQVGLKTIQTLLDSGVAERDQDTGALASRRMIRDEMLRKVRSKAGKKGGNPVLLKQNPTTGVKQIPEYDIEDETLGLVGESEGKPPPIEAEILAHLNAKAGRSYRRTDGNLKLIAARLREVDGDAAGVKTMIDRQCALWLGDPKMEEFLRPETLFGKTKFGGYYDNRNLPILGLKKPPGPDYSKGF